MTKIGFQAPTGCKNEKNEKMKEKEMNEKEALCYRY